MLVSQVRDGVRPLVLEISHFVEPRGLRTGKPWPQTGPLAKHVLLQLEVRLGSIPDVLQDVPIKVSLLASVDIASLL